LWADCLGKQKINHLVLAMGGRIKTIDRINEKKCNQAEYVNIKEKIEMDDADQPITCT